MAGFGLLVILVCGICVAVQSAPIDCEFGTFSACSREMGSYFSNYQNKNSKEAYCEGYQVFANCLSSQRGCAQMISNKLWFSFFMDLYVTQKVACPSLNYTALVTMSQGLYKDFSSTALDSLPVNDCILGVISGCAVTDFSPGKQGQRSSCKNAQQLLECLERKAATCDSRAFVVYIDTIKTREIDSSADYPTVCDMMSKRARNIL